uniref:Cysteine protease n=1 Tax=Eptatretus burgeri TaxID=7764 RepID=A0A8C4NKR4_EPTBU
MEDRQEQTNHVGANRWVVQSNHTGAVPVPVASDCNGYFGPGVSKTEDPEVDEVDKLKAKLMSSWNNLKHGWIVKTKTNFSRHSPIVLLGRLYNTYSVGDSSSLRQSGECQLSDSRTPGGSRIAPDSRSLFVAFRQDFVSRIWITYRREFPQLEGSSLTTDCGWGCMLRSGQMLMAQALLQHFLSRDWRSEESARLLTQNTEARHGDTADNNFVFVGEGSYSNEMPEFSQISIDDLTMRKESSSEVAKHRHILALFADQPGAPLGIHQLVTLGRSSGKKAGDWYGPAIVAHIFRKALECTNELTLQDLTLYVAQDCTVYKKDVMELCGGLRDGASRSRSTPSGSCYVSHGFPWRAVIILVPVRLGGETFNPVYIPYIKKILGLESCIGIIGGKPKHSLYFVGFQDDHIIYLDPHCCQPFVETSQKDFSVESYHCCSPRKTAFSKLDPSCTLGFYCKTRDDFFLFCQEIQKVLGSDGATGSQQHEAYSIFTLLDGKGSDLPDITPFGEEIADAPSTAREAKSRGKKRVVHISSSDDFVLL